MKERGLLFSPVMVKATIDDIKTMTRRTRGLDKINENPDDWEYVRFYDQHAKFCEKYNHVNEVYVKCPYGVVNDILYVKETFYAYGHWSSLTDTVTGKTEWSFKDLTIHEGLEYMYEGWLRKDLICKGRKKLGWHKRPSLFMPHVASRMDLQISEISCERIKEITQEDAMSEGVFTAPHRPIDCGKILYENGSITRDCHVCSFQMLWNQINGPKGFAWDKNPYVWVIKFKKISKS